MATALAYDFGHAQLVITRTDHAADAAEWAELEAVAPPRTPCKPGHRHSFVSISSDFARHRNHICEHCRLDVQVTPRSRSYAAPTVRVAEKRADRAYWAEHPVTVTPWDFILTQGENPTENVDALIADYPEMNLSRGER